LSILSSLLNVQANTVHDATARGALRTSQNRLRAMAALHSHLEGVGTSQGTGMEKFVAGLVAQLRSSYEVPESRVAVHLRIPDDLALPKEWLMPLTMSLIEALSNAFEHAFPDGRSGQVTVEMGIEGPQATLTIADTGVGLPDTVAAMAEQGMGLKILALFAEQMKGKLEVVNQPEKGTKVKMQFFIAFTDN
jgi:two-component sensor histidine kinase